MVKYCLKDTLWDTRENILNFCITVADLEQLALRTGIFDRSQTLRDFKGCSSSGLIETHLKAFQEELDVCFILFYAALLRLSRRYKQKLALLLISWHSLCRMQEILVVFKQCSSYVQRAGINPPGCTSII